MDEKTAPVKTDTPASLAPVDEKPATPAPDAAEKPTTQPTPAVPAGAPAKKTSPFVRILILLFILVDLALAGYIVYRMMMQG